MREGDEATPPPACGRGPGGRQAIFRQSNTARASDLRNNASPPERLLWQRLRNRQLDGHKFSRQIPVGPFFADFLCREQKLVVRDRYFAAQGLGVPRIRNADVMANPEGVLLAIVQALNAHPQPLPQAGGEKRSS